MKTLKIIIIVCNIMDSSYIPLKAFILTKVSCKNIATPEPSIFIDALHSMSILSGNIKIYLFLVNPSLGVNYNCSTLLLQRSW